jgi:hypothetical protein
MSSVPVSDVTLHLLLDMAGCISNVKFQIENAGEKLSGQYFWHILKSEKRTKHVVQIAAS